MVALLPLLALSSVALSPLALAHDAGVRPRHIQLMERRMELLMKRQATNGTVSAAQTTAAAAGTTAAAATTAPVAETTGRGIAGTSAASSSEVEETSIATSAPVAPTTSAPAPATTSGRASRGSTTVVPLTVTDPSSSRTSSATSSAASSSVTSDNDESSSSSSGISRATLIAIIAVASSVALIAAVWTIVRKVKFGTSKRFEAKLAPIAFDDGDKYAGGRDGLHGRTESTTSHGTGMGGPSFRTGQYATSLSRSDSGERSLRGAPMSEVSHLPGSTSFNGAPAGHYAQQPYYGQAPPPSTYGGSQAGSFATSNYPREQQQYGNYANLQRGPSTNAGYAAGGAYNYQAHQQQGGGRY